MLSVGTTVNAALGLPAGFRVRAGVDADLPALGVIYAANTRDTVGAAVRPPGGFVWAKLRASLPSGECRVVEDGEGRVVAYAWQARGCWAVRAFSSGGDENAFRSGEVMAADGQAADAVLAACRAWAGEEAARREGPIHQVRFAQPPVGPVAEALKFQHAYAQQRWQPDGGFMARVVSVERLLAALAPELTRRLTAAGHAFSGALHLRTDIGEGAVPLHGARLTPGKGAHGGSPAVDPRPPGLRRRRAGRRPGSRQGRGRRAGAPPPAHPVPARLPARLPSRPVLGAPTPALRRARALSKASTQAGSHWVPAPARSTSRACAGSMPLR